MAFTLFDHLPGCSPLRPCVSCEAAEFLRSRLSEDDYRGLIAKVSPKGLAYSAGNPVPLDASVDILDLSVRSAICLQNDNVRTIGDLVQKSEAEMLRMPHFGRKSLNEINGALAAVGRRLGEIGE